MINCDYIDFTNLDQSTLFEILQWRNHDAIRSNMFNNQVISEREHWDFISSLTGNANKRYFLVLKNNTPIGVVSLINIETNHAEGGLYLNPIYLGQKMGKDLLDILIYIAKKELSLHKLLLIVKKNNPRALKLYLKYGFQIEDQQEEYIVTGKALA